MANSQAKPLQRDLFLSDAEADAHDLYEAIRTAVDDVGFKEILFQLGDCDRTTLSNRINCRDGRTPSARLVLLLCQAQPSGALLAHLCKASGFAAPERLSDEDDGSRLKRLLRDVRTEFGKAGERVIARAFTRRPSE